MRFLCCAALLLVANFLYADTKAPAGMHAKNDMAILFHLENLTEIVSPYNDGFQGGAGFKYWFSERISGRALLAATVTPNTTTDTSTTTLGLSIAGEYHPRPGRASPYIGGIVGTQFRFDDTGNYFNYSAGALGGVEVLLFSNFSIYGEYQALLVHDVDGLGFRLGDQALLGFAIYF
jgi:outer membrane protein W